MKLLDKARSSIKTRFLLALLLTGLLPALVISGLILARQTDDLETQATAELANSRDAQAHAVSDYLGTIRGQITTFAQRRSVVDAMAELPAAFESMGAETGVDDAARAEVSDKVAGYYDVDFAGEYRERNDGAEPSTRALLAALDESTILAQYAYITGNRYPLGSKEKLDDAGNGTRYDALHARIHPSIRALLEEFGYYDIFLADAKSGKIVYSVFKELDYGTSLIDGPYASTNIGRVFRDAAGLASSSDVAFVDYETYGPSYDAPASFIASPIYDGRTLLGVAIFQMPLDRLGALVGRDAAQGADSVLVGADRRLRTDSKLVETATAAASFRDELSVDLSAVDMVERRETGVVVDHDLGGREALVAYTPIEFGGATWGLVTTLDTDTAFAAAATAQQLTVLTILLACGAIVGLAVWLTRDLGRGVSDLVEVITQQARAISRGHFLHRNEPSAARFDEFVPLLSSINEMASAFSSQLDEVPVPIVVHGPALESLYVNKAAAKLAGRDADALVGATYYDAVAPEGWHEPAYATRRCLHDGVHAQTKVTCTIGGSGRRDIDSTVMPLRDDTGHAVAVMETLLDETTVMEAQRRQERVSQYQAREVSRLSAVLDQIIAGDLTARYHVEPLADAELTDAQSSFAEIATGVERTVEDFARTIQTLRSNADHMARAAEGLADLAGQLLDGNETTAREAAAVAAATEEMSTNVDSVASAAEEMSINLGSVSENATAISSKMRSVAEAIATLNTSIGDVAEHARNGSVVAADAASKSAVANDAMNTLGKAAGEIGKVTEVIKRIAEKTNLLALNATIEAASAGEAGKGFAVVAHEIKELANQCAAAAEDITERIGGVQRNTEEAITVITSMSEIITELTVASEKISENATGQSRAVQEISSDVRDVDSGVERTASAIAETVQGANDVSRNAGELSQGASEVSSKIGSVNGLAQSGGEAGRRVGDAARELTMVVAELREAVARFRLHEAELETSVRRVA